MICKLYFVCIFAMFSVISSEHFCQKFRDNGDKIGFTFRREFKPPSDQIGLTEIQIIIDGQCWGMLFEHKKFGKPPNFRLPNTESNNCPFFSKEYKFGMCLNIHSVQMPILCDAILFNINTKTGVVGQIPNDDHNSYKALSEYKLKTNLSFKGLNGINFMSGYPSDRRNTYGKLVFITLENRKLEGRLFDWNSDGNTFEFKKEDNIMVIQDFPVLSGEHTVGNEDVLAIIYQYSEYNEQLEKPKYKDGGFGYILLLKKDTEIRWCWTSIWKYECKSGGTLINCDKFKRLTKSTESTESPEIRPEGDDNKNLWLYPIIITVAIIIVILIVGIAVFVIKNRKSEQQPEATSVTSAAPKQSTVVTQGFSSAFSVGKSEIKRNPSNAEK